MQYEVHFGRRKETIWETQGNPVDAFHKNRIGFHSLQRTCGTRIGSCVPCLLTVEGVSVFLEQSSVVFLSTLLQNSLLPLPLLNSPFAFLV